MGRDADDFSRESISVTMDPTKISKPPSAEAMAKVEAFHKKAVNYDAKNFPATNQGSFCW